MEAVQSYVEGVKAGLWTECGPEQQRLTIQLARNSFYFVTAIILIKQFGEQIAI